MMLGEALERKGVNAQIPQNQQFQAAENRIDKARLKSALALNLYDSSGVNA